MASGRDRSVRGVKEERRQVDELQSARSPEEKRRRVAALQGRRKNGGDSRKSSGVSPIDAVSTVLEGYAQRGVFRGFSRGQGSDRKQAFRLLWHRDLLFELILDLERHTLRFPLVLPQVDPKSAMYQKFKEFLKSRQSDEMPEHRRIDTRKSRVRSLNRSGSVSLTLEVKDEDYEYGARKLIHLVHEIFMGCLVDGPYYEYMVEHLGLNPDGA